MGKHRCIPHPPLEDDDDGARAWGRRRTSWRTAEHRHGTIRTVAQATQTSVGLGAVNCWPRKFAVLRPGVTEEEIRAVAERLLALAA